MLFDPLKRAKKKKRHISTLGHNETMAATATGVNKRRSSVVRNHRKQQAGNNTAAVKVSVSALWGSIRWENLQIFQRYVHIQDDRGSVHFSVRTTHFWRQRPAGWRYSGLMLCSEISTAVMPSVRIRGSSINPWCEGVISDALPALSIKSSAER